MSQQQLRKRKKSTTNDEVVQENDKKEEKEEKEEKKKMKKGGGKKKEKEEQSSVPSSISENADGTNIENEKDKDEKDEDKDNKDKNKDKEEDKEEEEEEEKDEEKKKMIRRMKKIMKMMMTTTMEFSKENPSYWLTTVLIIRCMAILYGIGFLVAWHQNEGLIGKDGIYPFSEYLQKWKKQWPTTNILGMYWRIPTLLWFMPWEDTSLEYITVIGLIVSVSIAVFPNVFSHAGTFLLLWLCYHSIVNVGQLFYGYGWESQLLETGFLCIFLARFQMQSIQVQLNEQRALNKKRRKNNIHNENNNNNNANADDDDSDNDDDDSEDDENENKDNEGENDEKRINPSSIETIIVPPNELLLFLFLWLNFRIMLGAGLIKIRAGQCWLDFTCMDYHYETQPNPNPLSWYLHNNSHWFHVFEVGINHFVELIACWLLLIPFRKYWLIGSIIQVLFQLALVFSGNLSFLNWMTMVPALAGLDDAFIIRYLWFLFWPQEMAIAVQCQRHTKKDLSQHTKYSWSFIKEYVKPISLSHAIYQLLIMVLACLIAVYSIPVIENLISPGQIMNTSFDNFRIVNTYGAFGTVGHDRYEVIFQLTHDETITKNTKWTEVIFNCKPGPLDRRPCFITPYHYRLDWQIWFAGFPPHSPYTGRNPWIFLFARQLLRGHQKTLELLDPSFVSSFYGNNTEIKIPTFIKADMYHYKFTNTFFDKNWWTRHKTLDNYLPVIHLQDPQFQNVLRQLSKRI